MSQHYSNPDRAKEPHSLPDMETYHLTSDEAGGSGGWYYHYCFPGCLPDSDPFGPYRSEAEALEAARADAGERCPQCLALECEPECEALEQVTKMATNARMCVEED